MTAPASARLVVPVTDRDHIRGLAEAPVTLVEYGDFECPHCAAAHLVLESLERRLKGYFRLVFRHFPLTQVHPYAEPAAETAEAAATRKRFWDMHDLLFIHQRDLQPARLVVLAAMTGLDQKWLVEKLATHFFAGRIREDFNSGVRSGVNGTPTFFIDGIRYDQPVTVPALYRAIQQAAEYRNEVQPPVGG